jgi:hypothetical protein
MAVHFRPNNVVLSSRIQPNLFNSCFIEPTTIHGRIAGYNIVKNQRIEYRISLDNGDVWCASDDLECVKTDTTVKYIFAAMGTSSYSILHVYAQFSVDFTKSLHTYILDHTAPTFDNFRFMIDGAVIFEFSSGYVTVRGNSFDQVESTANRLQKKRTLLPASGIFTLYRDWTPDSVLEEISLEHEFSSFTMS